MALCGESCAKKLRNLVLHDMCTARLRAYTLHCCRVVVLCVNICPNCPICSNPVFIFSLALFFAQGERGMGRLMNGTI